MQTTISAGEIHKKKNLTVEQIRSWTAIEKVDQENGKKKNLVNLKNI